LLVPRNDGFLIVIDGEQTMKTMTAIEMLSLADRCLDAGLEMMRREVAADEC
jgi:hypothetical protein